MWIDSHTHLYDEQFTKDIEDVILKAQQVGVKKFLLPNCDSSTLDSMFELCEKYAEQCYPMVGLHPVYVKENFQQELLIMEKALEKKDVIAIGEIGLDFYWDRTYEKEQYIAFERQIDWALSADLPIVIHTRDSIPEGIEIVRKRQNGNLKGVFHCFSGNLEEALQIIDLGFYIGIGGVLTFKNSTLKNFIHKIPLDKILLETDAPYLAPVPYRGKRNESSYIPIIGKFLSDQLNTTVEEIESVTTQNTLHLFPNIQ